MLQNEESTTTYIGNRKSEIGNKQLIDQRKKSDERAKVEKQSEICYMYA